MKKKTNTAPNPLEQGLHCEKTSKKRAIEVLAKAKAIEAKKMKQDFHYVKTDERTERLVIREASRVKSQ